MSMNNDYYLKQCVDKMLEVVSAVNNTAPEPIPNPLPVSGSITATISGTPSVSATISGTPAVSISGTPAVTISSGTVTSTISGTPTVNATCSGTVAVTNTPLTNIDLCLDNINHHVETDLNALKGVALAVNSGSKSDGCQRVCVATDDVNMSAINTAISTINTNIATINTNITTIKNDIASCKSSLSNIKVDTGLYLAPIYDVFQFGGDTGYLRVKVIP